MSLRCGITTGTCAAAAAMAAALVLTGGSEPSQVELRLPSGSIIQVPILDVRYEPNSPAAIASVRKDAGDDPDVTGGLRIEVTISWTETDRSIARSARSKRLARVMSSSAIRRTWTRSGI